MLFSQVTFNCNRFLSYMLILESLTTPHRPPPLPPPPRHSYPNSHEDETPLVSSREVDEFESSAEVASRTW